MFSWILDAVVIDETFIISDTKGEELKMWTESQRNEFGRQFFNETYWKKQKWEEGKYVFHKWILNYFQRILNDIDNEKIVFCFYVAASCRIGIFCSREKSCAFSRGIGLSLQLGFA